MIYIMHINRDEKDGCALGGKMDNVLQEKKFVLGNALITNTTHG